MPFDNRHARVAADVRMHLAMPDIDRRDMRRAAFQQHLGEAAGRSADIERLAAGGVEAEIVEPGDQLQRRARHVSLRRIIDGDEASGRGALARLAGDDTIDRYRAALDRVTGARAAGEQAARDEQFVEPLACAGWRRGVHRPSWRKPAAMARILGWNRKHGRKSRPTDQAGPRTSNIAPVRTMLKKRCHLLSKREGGRMLTGPCHCGAAHWTLEGDPGSITACNCTLCSRYGALGRTTMSTNASALRGP